MIILDAGALIGIEKGNAHATALIKRAMDNRLQVHVPATVLAQVWRNSPRQHPIGRLLGAAGVEIIDLDRRHAQAVGALLAGSGTADVVDAHVIVCARLTRARAVITSDPGDLRALDPDIRLEVV
ncbi:PIN domain-containing protein [Nocardia vinacea]|uniref:PIN domain-containing protein n=1 Tax=Nocardia vinacea TaxID=96468 RepID=A0ABZ1Z122_9NOCA|nr:PIN domain-containing protein [Nocardia vinacea]